MVASLAAITLIFPPQPPAAAPVEQAVAQDQPTVDQTQEQGVTEDKNAPLLEYNRLKIKTTLGNVGVTKEGIMGAPNRLDRAVWYNKGPKPGSKGNAVVAAHYGDDKRAGLFRPLEGARLGDEISVTVAGVNTTYKVVKIASYKPAEAPLQDIFGATNATNLNLVTCFGKQINGDYEERLVIFATKK